VAAAGNDSGLTQRELLMEMPEDIKGLKATVDAIARDQALGAERRHDGTRQRWREERKTGRGERSRADTLRVKVRILVDGARRRLAAAS
jgi:hypothetical protein